MKNPLNAIRGQLGKLTSVMNMVYAKLDAETVVGAAADGKVKVTGNGRGRVASLAIDPAFAAEAAAGGDALGLLEDAIVAAISDMAVKAKAIQDEATKKHTGVLLPKGVELPMMT